MSKELFNRNIANEITLPSAIARHILKIPKYITALYTIDEEIEQLKKRIFTLHHIIMAFKSS